jgi:hypothetical protein
MDDSYPLRDSCPLCGAPNCARFIGCYEREVVDEKGYYYKDFPVPWFLCQEKGTTRTVKHKTFSLLHYHLVPYWKYSIPFIINVLKAKHIEGMSQKMLLDYMADFTTKDQHYEYDYMELSLSRIFSFHQLIKETIGKIMISVYYPEIIEQFQTSSQNQQIKAFLTFSLHFSSYKLSHSHPIRGPTALSIDFYLTSGSYFQNSCFLFGTPSQFRRWQTPRP